MIEKTEKKKKVVISTASTVVFVLVTCLTVYLYGSYARPETVHPEILEKDLEKRSNGITLAINSIKSKFPSNLNTEGGNKSKPADDLEPEGSKVPTENEVKKLFNKVLAEKASTPAASAASTKIQPIAPIEMPEIVIKPPSEPIIQNCFRKSRQIYQGQVGLSLAADEFFSAVYRIQNLFGISGLVGHFYVIKSKLGWKEEPFSFETIRVNFSDKDKFKEFFEGKQIEELLTNDGYSEIFINRKYGEMEKFKAATTPEQTTPSTITVNPYKWLYLSTKFPLSNEPIYALVYPKDLKPNHYQIAYPDDVRVYEFDWMRKADLNLHSGCPKRILNHCRDYLPEENIDL